MSRLGLPLVDTANCRVGLAGTITLPDSSPSSHNRPRVTFLVPKCVLHTTMISFTRLTAGWEESTVDLAVFCPPGMATAPARRIALRRVIVMICSKVTPTRARQNRT